MRNEKQQQDKEMGSQQRDDTQRGSSSTGSTGADMDDDTSTNK